MAITGPGPDVVWSPEPLRDQSETGPGTLPRQPENSPPTGRAVHSDGQSRKKPAYTATRPETASDTRLRKRQESGRGLSEASGNLNVSLTEPPPTLGPHNQRSSYRNVGDAPGLLRGVRDIRGWLDGKDFSDPGLFLPDPIFDLHAQLILPGWPLLIEVDLPDQDDSPLRLPRS